MTAPYYKELNNICKGIVFMFQTQKMYMDLYHFDAEGIYQCGLFFKDRLSHCTQFCREYPPPFPPSHTPLTLDKNRAHFCSSLIEMTTGAIKT